MARSSMQRHLDKTATNVARGRMPLCSTRQDGMGITVDRVDKGTGPLTARLSAGEHTITARLDGRTQTKTVWVPQQSVITFDMGQQP